MSSIVGNENLRTLWDNLAEIRGERSFLEFQACGGARQSFTYRQFNERINQTANALMACGVKQGDRVAMQLYNTPEFLSVLFGIVKAGAIAVPLNMQHKLEECAFVLRKCAITTIVTEPDYQIYYRAEDSYPIEQVLVCHAQGEELLGDAKDFDALVAGESVELREVRPIQSSDTAEIMFTSGTTSCPKGVEITHANMLYGGMYGVWEFALTPEDRFFTTMPAFHSNFQLSALMPVLAAGATLVFVAKYSARAFWKQVRSYRATAVQAVAMMVRTMMLQPVDQAERDHCVRTIQYYLAISEAEKDAFEERFGVRLQNCYGSTESICWALTDLPFGPRRWPSVGRAGLGYEVEIVDDEGCAVAPGELGEIVIRGIAGVTLMKGYYNDESSTSAALDERGWLHTGDKGYRDESGWFFFVDRKSNMIKRAGENISASEVEEVLMAHASVAEAAVIGVPDPIRDQAVKAFIVLERDAEADVEELERHCACHLADFKVPTIFKFVEALPHTSVGKVEKKLLR